jgi:hypothetical protein
VCTHRPTAGDSASTTSCAIGTNTAISGQLLIVTGRWREEPAGNGEFRAALDMGLKVGRYLEEVFECVVDSGT